MIYLVKDYKNKQVDTTNIPNYFLDEVKGNNILEQKKLWYSFLRNILRDDYDLNLDELIISYNEYGKPYLNYPLYFSIAHTDRDLLMGISNHEIGIDMETIRKYEPLVAKKLFTVKEQEKACNNDYLFTKIFVMKEAYGKCEGRGLGEYLREIEVNDLDNMQVIDYDNLIIGICNSNNNEIKEL